MTLLASGISPEAIDARGYVTVPKGCEEELRKLGFSPKQCRTPGLLIPMYDMGGELASYQFRPDHPRVVGGKPVKYESLPGVSPVLDVPVQVRERLLDPSVEVWITEGAKKADAAVTHDVCCVSLSGVWCFRRTLSDGSKGVIEELDRVPLNGRSVVVCFDSDVMRKTSVRKALLALAKELAERGAVVRFAILDEPGGEKVGLDDYLAKGGRPEDIPMVEPNDLPKVESAPKKGGKGRPKGGQVAEILQAALDAGLELWRDLSGEPHATFPKGAHRENVPCEGRELQGFLYASYRERTGERPSIQALRDAQALLALQARHEGPTYPTALRIHAAPGEAYVFLADEGWRVFRVDAAGWRLLGEGEEPPVRFLRKAGALRLPTPREGGDLERLREVLSVSDVGFAFVKAWLLALFLPKGGLPILLATGEHGSGKSSGCGLIRSVLDPCRSPLGPLPTDVRALATLVGSNHALGFDNVSRVDPDTADLLCSVSTGLGITFRALYTNNDEFSVPARAPIVLNGIGDVVTRPDLLDRTLPVEFVRIEGAGTRLTEEELQARFAEIHPFVLGALLDLVSLAFRNLPGLIMPRELPRLADMGRFVTACEPEGERGRFLDLLRQARSGQSADMVEGDRLAFTLAELAREKGSFEGPATDLLRELNGRLDVHDRPASWPKNAALLGARLQRLAPALRAIEVDLERLARTGKARAWRVRLLQAHPDGEVPSGAPDIPVPSLGNEVLDLGIETEDTTDGGDAPSQDVPAGSADEGWREVEE